jgi:hypothetical protein
VPKPTIGGIERAKGLFQEAAALAGLALWPDHGDGASAESIDYALARAQEAVTILRREQRRRRATTPTVARTGASDTADLFAQGRAIIEAHRA